MSPAQVHALLDRPERPLRELAAMAMQELRAVKARVLVTGAAGTIGGELVARLEAAGVEVLGTDIDTMDVRWPHTVAPVMREYRPTLVLHLAAAKHAPLGELEVYDTALTNVEGTWNVVRQSALVGARVIAGSTAKACHPETAYGASKLLAERITLGAGGSIARFHNVAPSSGNVFEIWASLPEDEPLPVAYLCRRFFISLEEAISLVLTVTLQDPGRYITHPGEPRYMVDVARSLYPERELELIPPRRGDRHHEPLVAEHERLHFVHGSLVQVTSPYEETL